MMKGLHRTCVLVAGVLLVAGGRSPSAEPNDSSRAVRDVKAAVIPCKDLIDDGLFLSIRRRTDAAIESGCEYLIYEISTYGGLLKSADDISKYLIQDVGKRAHTVAYVTTEAISAGAMISVSCKDIIMRESTTIGDCAPITLGGKLEGVEREKTESFTRAAFMRAAEANGYPAAMLKAMVTMQTVVYRIENLQTGELEFFEDDRLPNDPNKYGLDKKQLIVADDELLTLTDAQAKEYGIARAVVNDVDGVLGFLAERDGVRFAVSTPVLETNWSEEMVRWLNSPAVMSVLVMLALLGAYIEFNTPGVGLPGLAAVICIVIIIGSKHLDGLANWLEVLLFVAGVILLIIEAFVLPGFGIAGMTGIACLLAGVFGMLVKNEWYQVPGYNVEVDWNLMLEGMIGLGGGFVGFAILAWAFTKYAPKTKLFSGLILVPAPAGERASKIISMTGPAAEKSTGLSVGDVGQVVSALRPTGRASFGKTIVDVVAEADFVTKGVAVEIIEIHGNRVVVRSVES